MVRPLPLLLVLVAGVAMASAQLRYLPAEPPHRPDAAVDGMLKVRLTAEAARDASTVLASLGLRIERAVLPYERSLTARQDRTLRRGASLSEALAIEERLLRSYVVAYDRPGIPPERMVEMLRPGCGPIECAAPWCVAELAGEPNDPQLDRQRMLNTIQAYAAWDVEPGSDTVVIGISDSGLMMDHEDLRDALFVRTSEVPSNGIDDDGNGYVDDHRGYNFTWSPDGSAPGETFNPKNSHGTGVGGICGATVNNGVGIAGVANRCRIFPLRTMPDNSTGIVYGYESIMYCALNDIDVVNCSWGGRSPSCIDEDVIAYAIARGTAVVAAAGNHNSASPFYPGSYRGVLGVGVVDPEDGVVEMTGRGPTVDVMAPGHGSWTTDNGGGYFGFCCTSGSSPIAAAIVALVRSRNPELAPREACAIVRDAVDESPWNYVPESIDTLLLPRGRVNALRAVTADPDTLISFEVDSVTFRSSRPDGRWTVGDTLVATASIYNVLAPWTIKRHGPITVVSSGSPAIRPLASDPTLDLFADHGTEMSLPPLSFVVERETDTTAYIIVQVEGVDGNDRSLTRRYSFAVTPAPAFTTLANDRMRVSIGDRTRIGNTDIDRGQGEGFHYDQWCGQLYEGGLMVSANGRVVDAVRAVRGTNDHFRPIKRFIAPEPSTGIVEDADAPDSLRIGVEVELDVNLDPDHAILVIDATVTNRSASTLHDLAVAWFYDWDLGGQPANNRTFRTGDDQIVCSVEPRQPCVLLRSWSYHSDAQAIACGLDNTTTYGGFPTERKLDLLSSGENEQYDGVNDVAAIVGTRFTTPVPPGHRRMFRHIIAVDTSVQGAYDLLSKRFPESTPVDTLFADGAGPIYPNPATDVITIPSGSITFSPARYEIYDAVGKLVRSVDLANVPGAQVLVTVDVRDLPIGAYRVLLSDPMQTRTWSFIVAR